MVSPFNRKWHSWSAHLRWTNCRPVCGRGRRKGPLRGARCPSKMAGGGRARRPVVGMAVCGEWRRPVYHANLLPRENNAVILAYAKKTPRPRKISCVFVCVPVSVCVLFVCALFKMFYSFYCPSRRDMRLRPWMLRPEAAIFPRTLTLVGAYYWLDQCLSFRASNSFNRSCRLFSYHIQSKTQ